MGGERFKAGEAPWEKQAATKPMQPQQTGAPTAARFKAGEAPWETGKPEAKATAPTGVETTTVGDAALQAFGQGPALGYLPEMQAGLETGLNYVLPESMGGVDPDYAKSLSEWRKQNDTLKTEHPGTSTGMNILGTVMALPAGGAAKGASTTMKLLKSAGVGATYGGLANTENPEGDYLDLQQRFKNAGWGGLFGAGGEGLGIAAPKFLAEAGKKLKDSAVVKQIGANAGQIKKIIQKKNLPIIGKFLQDEGMMGVGMNTEKVAEKTLGIMEQDGPKIGQLYKDAQDQIGQVQNTVGVNSSGTRISGNELADDIMAQVQKEVKNNPNREQVLTEMEKSLIPLRDMGDNANIIDVHDFRKGLDENIDWTKASREKDVMQRAYTTARNKVADKAMSTIDAMDTFMGGNKLTELKTLNKRFSSASTVNSTSTQATGREMAKVLMGGAINSIGGGLAAQGTYAQSRDPVKTGAAFILGSLLTGGVRKMAVPMSYQMGRAASKIGEVAAPIGDNVMKTGVALPAAVSPWMNMQEKKK